MLALDLVGAASEEADVVDVSSSPLEEEEEEEEGTAVDRVGCSRAAAAAAGFDSS